MWKELQNTHYFINFSDKLEVFITDYIKIWALYLTDKSFLALLIASNIRLQKIDEKELLEKGKHMLSNPNELKSVSVKEVDGVLEVCMKVSYGYPLKLNMKLLEGPKELFFQKVTQSLLRVIQDLKSSEQELRHLLQKKDNEIKEYKLEGGKIALRTLKTVPFNDDAHTEKHQAFGIYFQSPAIPQSLLEKTISLPEQINVPLKEEIQEGNGTHRDSLPIPPKTEPEIKIKNENQMQSEKRSSIKAEPKIQISNEIVDIQPDSLRTIIKTESEIQIQNEINTELQSNSQLSTVSPRKKRKIKLNF